MTGLAAASPRVALEQVAIRDLRNLAQVELEPASRLNVISGNNGQGKTSLLEAIYLLATSKSFRTSRLAELIRHGAQTASIRGRFCEDSGTGTLRRDQSTGLESSQRALRIDGEPPASVAHYATRSPVVVFDPSQMALSTGPASGRRQLLDRVSLFAVAETAAHRARYARALKARQRLLGGLPGRGVSPAAGGDELAAFEALLATHGAAITEARQRAAVGLAAGVAEAFGRIAQPGLELTVDYRPAGSTDPAEARRRLREGRRADAHRRRAGFGPHLDDLALNIGGHPARIVGSQGQHRAITLALKLAELGVIAQARGLLPIFLLDDVSSELDPERSQALLDYLATARCQIFLTTTRRDLVIAPRVAPAERLDIAVVGGSIERL